MPKFNLKDLMPAQTDSGKNDTQLLKISIDRIKPHRKNEYGIRDIEELASSIEQVGLLQPIRVKKDNESGEYIIISGERRYTAYCRLAKHDDKYRMIPCIVAGKADEYTDELELLIANIQTRQLTDYEKVYQAQRAKELIESMRRAGAEIKGRTRENIALILNTSPTQIARYERIYKRLGPLLSELFKSDTIGISDAYALSGLSDEEQMRVYKDISEKGFTVHQSLVVKELEKSEKTPEDPKTEPLQRTEIHREQEEITINEKGTEVRIYQINSERDMDKLKFMGYSSVYDNNSTVNRSIYDEVFSGRLTCKSLEEIYKTLNSSEKPKEYKGHSLSVSDVVEVKNSLVIENGFFYCDNIGFKKIKFGFFKTEPAKTTEKKSAEEDKKLMMNDCENIYKDICDILQRNLKDDREYLHLMRLMWEAFRA